MLIVSTNKYLLSITYNIVIILWERKRESVCLFRVLHYPPNKVTSLGLKIGLYSFVFYLAYLWLLVDFLHRRFDDIQLLLGDWPISIIYLLFHWTLFFCRSSLYVLLIIHLYPIYIKHFFSVDILRTLLFLLRYLFIYQKSGQILRRVLTNVCSHVTTTLITIEDIYSTPEVSLVPFPKQYCPKMALMSITLNWI